MPLSSRAREMTATDSLILTKSLKLSGSQVPSPKLISTPDQAYRIGAGIMKQAYTLRKIFPQART